MLKIILIPGILIFCASLSAQEPIHYTTKQGLPTNHIYDMAEDADGFMWFATKQGVVKFDGETFKTFTLQDGLPNNDTWRVESDFQGKIWYFSKSEYQGYILNDSIYKFPIQEKKVISARFLHKSKDNISISNSLGVHKLEDSIFVSKYNIENHLEQYNKHLKSYNKEQARLLSFPYQNIYIGLLKQDLLVIDEKQQKETVIRLPFKPNDVECSAMPNDTFIISFTEGFMFMDLKTLKHTVFLFKDLIGEKIIQQVRIKPLSDQIQLSGPGYLLIFSYQFELLNSYIFPETKNIKSTFSYQDTKGNIWQNSLSKGITLIPNTQRQVSYYLKNEKIQRVNLFDNRLFVGIQNKGFYQFNKEQNTFNKRNDIPSGGNIYNIKKNSLTQIDYLLSDDNSYIVRNGSNSFIPFRATYSRQDNMFQFKDLLRFKGYTYFLTSSEFGIKDNTSFKINVINKAGLLNLEVFKNSVYTGGSDGLYQFINDELIKPKSENELLNASIISLSTSNNNLLVGTDGRGVYLYNEKETIHLIETDGLSVQRILKEADTLWLATQIGIKKVLLNGENLNQSKIIDAFYETDGILQNNTNDIYKKDNLLYVASDIGLSKINLNNPVYKQQPKLYFKTKNDTLSYKNSERDNIAITFALQDYVNQEYVTYQYKLLPTQNEWTTTETKTLNFTNLPPKLYQLEIKATDQHSNQSISSQYLNVIPAWYQTLTVRIGFGILVLASLYLLFRIMKRRVQKREHSKAQQEKREAGLELQALRSQMNPHFVHNSLNAIQYFIQRNEVELSENYLSKFSQLIRLFFEYSRRQTITIQEELELLTNYLEIEKLRFEEKLQFHITVCENIDPEEQLIPSMLLQPIVENAVNHGLFHKKESGTVEVLFKQLNENTYEVTVKDDGIGINKSKSIYNVSSKNYQSNSSKVLYERLELLNKSKEWTIEYKIEDISDIEVNKTGTIVTLIFKQNMGQ